MRNTTFQFQRSGISLLEVLISVGVIALGIFGVASLIPVAQLSVDKGLTADRQAALGRSAIADFRIRNMGSPGTFIRGVIEEPNWLTVPMVVREDLSAGASSMFDSKTGQLKRRGYCLDPLGVAESIMGSLGAADANVRFFPAGANDIAGYLLMPRVSLRSMTHGIAQDQQVELARQAFMIRDDMVFQRPDDQALQPNRQYFVTSQGVPVRSYAEGKLSWFATITPTISNVGVPTDQYVLSVVVVKNRITTPTTEEGLAVAETQFAGEIVLRDAAPELVPGQMRVADLRVGNWLLLAKRLKPNNPENKAVYRWTRIIGDDGREGVTGVDRRFTIANDDFFRPTAAGGLVGGHAVFMRDVVAVYERVIRLENSTSWN